MSIVSVNEILSQKFALAFKLGSKFVTRQLAGKLPKVLEVTVKVSNFLMENLKVKSTNKVYINLNLWEKNQFLKKNSHR